MEFSPVGSAAYTGMPIANAADCTSGPAGNARSDEHAARQGFSCAVAPRRSSTCTVAARIPLDKLTPYVPRYTKPLLGPPNNRMSINLNGKVRVGLLDEPVYCIDLALEYLHTPKFLDRFAQTEKDLRKIFDANQMEVNRTRFKAWLTAPAHTRQLVGNHGFGPWMADKFRAMQRLGVGQVNVLLLTLDHAMAVRLQIKHDSDGASRIRVCCYDPNGNPNGTGNHLAFEAYTPDELHARTLADCFANAQDLGIGSESPQSGVVAFCAHAPRTDEPSSTRYANPATPFDLAMALKYHLPTAAASLSADVLRRGNPELTQQCIDVLLNVERNRDAQSLYFAMCQGNTEVAVELADALKKFGITGEAARTALEARGVVSQGGLGDPAVFSAVVEHGHVDAFVKMAQALNIVGLTGLSAQSILEARNEQGVPALSAAVERGHVAAITFMAEALKLAELPGPAAATVLTGRDAHNQPLLHKAARMGRIEPFVEMAHALRSLKLSPELVQDVLQAHDRDGTPAFLVAAECAPPGVFVAFANALQIAGIHGKAAKALIAAPSRSGYNTLHVLKGREGMDILFDYMRASETLMQQSI